MKYPKFNRLANRLSVQDTWIFRIQLSLSVEFPAHLYVLIQFRFWPVQRSPVATPGDIKGWTNRRNS